MPKPVLPQVTKKQRIAYHALANFIEREKRSPTFRELAAELGRSSSHPGYALMMALFEKGYVTWETNVPRSLTILRQLPPPSS